MNVLLLLPMACLPQDDLASYSRAWENRPAPTSPNAEAPGQEAPLDAGLASDGAPSAQGEEGANAGETPDAGDAGLLATDAGVEPNELDASSGAALDASSAPGADAGGP